MKTWKKRPKKLHIIDPNIFFSNTNQLKSSPNINSCSIKISHRRTSLKWLWILLLTLAITSNKLFLSRAKFNAKVSSRRRKSYLISRNQRTWELANKAQSVARAATHNGLKSFLLYFHGQNEYKIRVLNIIGIIK